MIIIINESVAVFDTAFPGSVKMPKFLNQYEKSVNWSIFCFFSTDSSPSTLVPLDCW